jgi:hypothetical protein
MRDNAAIFWTQCWINFAYLQSCEPSQNAFKRRLIRDGADEPAGSLREWRAGIHPAQPASASFVESRIAGTEWFYRLPMAALLSAQKLSVRRVRSLLAPYTTRNHLGELTWKFPNDDQLRSAHRLPFIRSYDDSQRLVERGDICGLMAILGLMRLAEAERLSDLHYSYARDFYRAVPAVAREPWLRPRVDALLEWAERVMSRQILSCLAFRVKWNIIRQQILAPEHEPNSRYWRRDPETGALNKPEDPIFELPVCGYVPKLERPSRLLETHERDDERSEQAHRDEERQHQERRRANQHRVARLMFGELPDDPKSQSS